VKKLTKKKSEFIISLEKELKKHWEDTKEEREKAHTSKLYQRLNKKEIADWKLKQLIKKKSFKKKFYIKMEE